MNCSQRTVITGRRSTNRVQWGTITYRWVLDSRFIQDQERTHTRDNESGWRSLPKRSRRDELTGMDGHVIRRDEEHCTY